MRRSGLLLWLFASAFVASAQPADVPPPPAGECDASRSVCENVVVTPPFHARSPELPPSAPQTFGGLRLQADAVLRNIALGDEPTGLKAVVTVHNPTTETLTLNMTGCQLLLLAYDHPDRASGTRYARATCRANCLDVLRLEPGGTQRIELDLNDYQLSSKLADGRYSFELHLILPQHTFTFSLGSADIRFIVPNLSYKAETHRVGPWNYGRLLTYVVVENHNAEPVLLTYGQCALLVRFYRTATRTGTPVYSRLVSPSGFCEAYLAASEVEPGGSLLADEFEVSVPMGEIKAAVDKPGYLYVQLNLELDWRATPVDAGVLYVSP